MILIAKYLSLLDIKKKFPENEIICQIYLYPLQIMIQNAVPLCSAQYERTFNTTRIPGKETDRLVHFDDSTHIVVYHAGRYFKVPCYYKGKLLNPKELQAQFNMILEDETLPEKGEAMLGALTAGERRPWAEAREKHFRNGINRASLEAIGKNI